MNTHPFTPRGCTYNGTSEIIAGRKLHHFQDGYTHSQFCVPDDQSDEASIQRHQREHRARFTNLHPISL